jgi:hypothetical protein
MIRRVILAAVSTCSLGAAVLAQDAGGLIDQARALVGEGKPLEAAKALENALIALANTMPLTVRSAVLVDDVSAYGAFAPRASNVFRSNDEVKLYVEPIGFTYIQENERYRVDLTGEFAVKTPSGQTILSQEELPRFKFESARPNREFYLQISYSFEGLRPGEYTIVTQLHDKPSGKSTSFETPIRVISDNATSSNAVPGGSDATGSPSPVR